MGPNPGWKNLKEFDRLKTEFKSKGFTLSVPPGSEPTSVNGPEWFSIDEWDNQKITISLSQLSAGLPIRLYNSEIRLLPRNILAEG
ncbi:hypothetical protein C5167_000839 [Papaver somniferum]|uniref:Uncharacterized protein n=1 Tax=Papaver somniferum TaxID=3469 RepID=A0A4Y7KWE3_PAPSO|nr:hypothetical protein C5167_000839 [Papaver somniferum]